MIAELPYQEDSAWLFEALADRPLAVFLDSGRPATCQGRYDILAADPMATLTTRGLLTEIKTRNGVEFSHDEPFALLRNVLGPVTPVLGDLPFCGGAIGYFAYDLARRLERLPQCAEDTEHIPEMAIGIYDWAVVVDHEARLCRLIAQGRDPVTHAYWDTLLKRLSSPSPARIRPPFRAISQPVSNMDRSRYGRAFRRIKSYIHEGDCYQVNLAQRFETRVVGDAWCAYQQLRRINPAPYGAFLHLPFIHVLSASPERFLSMRNGNVETKPIKGTRPRGRTPDQDRALADALCASAKDRAENLMIVDLLRNDIGKTCRAGSVRVPKLFDLESFTTVHHLVSTVTGTLADGCDALDLLRGCFPGGSITGAPKLRAMEIIEELEPHRRGVYCGAIGYIGFDGSMDTNIAIRTLIHSDGVSRFWAGGGIVADSQEDQEYQETLDKAAAMLSLLKLSETEYVGSY